MSQREQFIREAEQGTRPFSRLCEEFGISRKTGYKWLKRYREQGHAGLRDQSRRPHTSPRRSPPEVEQLVLSLRRKHPAWGGRKLHGHLKLNSTPHVPSPSTITAILRRQGQIDLSQSHKHRPMQRFERAHPNELWQMDFKGPFSLAGQNCFPLTVLDDHSRFLITLQACADQRRETVQGHLEASFKRYGLPEAMLVDNGPPWSPSDTEAYHTRLAVWLMRLGIRVIRCRPYHPQTLGKDERLHRTLKAELISRHEWAQFDECQNQFQTWRHLYNAERPHEALGDLPPISRYRSSSRPFPAELPTPCYPQEAAIRLVHDGGRISFRAQRFRVGRAFEGLKVGLLPGASPGHYDVYFCAEHIKAIQVEEVQ